MQGLQAPNPPKWHNFDFPAVRMIEVRNSSKPRDAASGHVDTSLRISYPIPQTSLPYTIHKAPLCDPTPDAITLYPRTRPHTPSDGDAGCHRCLT